MPQQAKDINDNLGMESPIYENLPTAATPTNIKNQPIPELRKYFPREAIYENLCRGCGYGVFAAQGRYCHFCQCIVSGGVVSPPPPPPPSAPLSPSESSNIYENICDLCRGIYSDNERCQCQRADTPTASPAATPTNTPTPTHTPPVKVKSRTLLGYSKSSAATLTRLFGSLKQLNRSSSLQRRIFPKTPSSSSGSGSLEIIHNVDEVFRTQETFDLQRICELKSQMQQQLKSSQSDQHIYGRVREPEDSKRERKKPRVSRMRLLQQDEKSEEPSSASLYLNESICQWMTSLRRQVHQYEEAGAWQQPKSVPPRERRTEEVTVTLRRSKDRSQEQQEHPDEQSMVKDFKRKLQLKMEPMEPPEPEKELRRCAITAEFVNDYLSALSKEKAEQQQVALIKEQTAAPTLPQLSLFRLMQSLALSTTLHVCVRGFLSAHDKSLCQWLKQQQQQKPLPISGYRRRRRARDSVWGDWRLFLFFGDRSVSFSPAISESDDVLCAAAPSRRAIRSRSLKRSVKRVREGEEEGVSGGESSTTIISSSSSSNENNNKNRALMAAPKPNGEAERPTSNNNNCSHNNNNNNNHNDDNESGNTNNNNNSSSNTSCNVSEQQQQQQQITQNCVIKVRRPAPKVPVRNPNTSLSNPRQSEEVDVKPNGLEKDLTKENSFAEENPDREEEEEEEEPIYQTIWQFKTLEPADQEIIEALPAEGEDDDEEEEDEDEDDDEVEDLEDYDESLPSDADADVMALQAAAVFAAGVRHKLSTSTLTKRSKLMLPTPLPSPTASMDQGAWETDMEFMYSRESKEEEETLSLGSTVTNSTATLGSISSTGSSRLPGLPPKDSAVDQPPPVVTQIVPLVHPILRNICIFYSLKDPKKYSAIFYDYQRSLVHQRFMTRIRRPAPPPPPSSSMVTPIPPMVQRNDDSGCSCEAEDQEEPSHRSLPIPQPLKEEWERAVLAAGAVAGKRGVAPRAGRKLRVRSNALLLNTDSVLAWRETLKDVYCCEDEEDMVSG